MGKRSVTHHKAKEKRVLFKKKRTKKLVLLWRAPPELSAPSLSPSSFSKTLSATYIRLRANLYQKPLRLTRPQQEAKTFPYWCAQCGSIYLL
jgi:hypothetical protein